MTNRRFRRVGAVLAILLVAAVGLCLLDGAHSGFDLCHTLLPAAAGGALVGLLLVGALAMPPALPHPPLVPALAAPAPV